MKKFSLKDARFMIRGASILSCGGGLSFIEQINYLKKISFKKKIILFDVDELIEEKNSVYITASEVGPSDTPPIDKSKMPLMMKLFTNKTGKKIKGIVPVEIGQETIVLDAAVKSNLPIINTDLAGMRAVPKVSLNALIAQNVVFTRSPFVALTKNGKIIFYKKNNSIEEDESVLRNLANKTGGVVFVIGGLIDALILKKYLNYPSLSTAINIGKSLSRNMDIEKSLPLKLVYRDTAVIKNIFYKKNTGFSEKIIYLKSKYKKNKQLTIKIINEYLSLTDGDSINYSFPQLITLIDRQKKRGLSGSELKEKKAVDVHVFQPLPVWANYKQNIFN